MFKELPKTYNPQDAEDEIYKKWEESGFFQPEAGEHGDDKSPLTPLYKRVEEKELYKRGDNRKTYTIVMPPPNATGTLHLGHAVMLALEDILIRYHRMKGDKTLWVPGTDHAAIATQTKVEKILKEEGTNRHKLGREKFLKRVNEFVEASRNTIRNQTKKMGSSCDWSREAFTLDEIRNKAVRIVFKMMYDDGLIYRGEKIVNWCPRCHSTLADDEVEYKKQKAKIYTFKYSSDFPFSISTTRPETKLGDTAVAVNPKDERYKKYIGETFEADFCGVLLKLKIIADRNVDMNFGTGAVGVTPAHSMVDWQMAQENGLSVVKVINEEGKIKEGFGEFSGKTAEEAREMLVNKLSVQGLIEKKEEMENNLSVCYRCETAIEPLPSLQWFISVDKKIPKYGKSIKELCLEAVKTGVFGREKIKIIPERFEKDYFHWMENLHDWCISRQIWYGHQVPVWYRVNKTIKQKNKKTKIEEEDVFVGEDEPGKIPLSPPLEKGETWVQDTDTLDTWFSSGMWTFTTMAKSAEEIKLKDGKLIIASDDFKNFHPTSVLETGYDILFFWVARMIIMTTYAVGDIPFQDVYLHGLIRDEKGKKMSKSLGNVIDPLDMIEKYGTDAVRLSLIMGSTPGNDTRLSEEKIAGFRNFTNKLWNIARYILQNSKLKTQNSPPEADQPLAENPPASAGRQLKTQNLSCIDLWILKKMLNLIYRVNVDLINYNFSSAGEMLRDFTWNDFADWYIEASKFEKNGQKEIILNLILHDLLKLWHPFIPFVTEAIWQKMGNEKILMIEKWPNEKFYKNIIKKAEPKTYYFEPVQKIIIAIRNAKSENNIEPLKKIKTIIYYTEKHASIIDNIKENEVLIKNLKTGIEELEIKEKGERIKNTIYTTVDGFDIYLIGAIDFEKEKKRLEKEIKEMENRITGLQKSLANTDFVQRAPVEIVNKEKEKLAEWESELGKMREQLEHLR